MKSLITVLFVLLLFSCQNENIEPSRITLDEAVSKQFISFEFAERKIELTDFKDNAWPFHGTIVWTDSIEFDTSSHHSISRAIYAFVPEDQVLEDHIETFGLEFNQVFPKEDVDTHSNTVLSDNQFSAEFLSLGEQDIELSNFGFHQTYFIGTAQKNNRSLRITQLERIVGHDNLMLVSGEFNGNVANDHSEIGELINGKFNVLIEN